MNSEILTELRKPFHPSQVTWKPGATSRDGTAALGMAYADVRAYQNRLDEVCGIDWSVSFTPWGDRIICHLTISGVTRSSTGEGDAQSERSEIAGTAAESQAFKRACAAFGLGRYLYNLPAVWADYDKERRTFSEKGRQKLDQIVWQHYRNGQPAPAEGQQNGAGHRQEPAATGQQPDPTDGLRAQFDELGAKLYGEQWEQTRRHNVERITEGKTQDYGQLNTDQIQRLIDGLKSLQRKRQAAKA